MFDWVAPHKRRFFFLVLAILVVEVYLITWIAGAEHRRFTPPEVDTDIEIVEAAGQERKYEFHYS